MGIQIKGGQEIAGYPALKIRNLLRKIADYSVAASWLCEKGYSETESSRLIDALLQLGYIEVDLHVHGKPETFYKLTEQGRSMMRASGARRVHRETAQKILDEFMDRVSQVNEDPQFAVRVTEVIVFGSYLAKNDTLGDLDIACKYESKFADLDPSTHSKKMHEHSSKSGRRFKSSMEALFWPWEEVRLFLKNRQRTISLHDVSEAVQMMKQSPDFRFEVLLGDPQAIATRR